MRGLCDIEKGGELRGCIGHIAPREPLFQGVIENTVNSSSKDWRFRPVTAGEISDITIEISVLSPPKMIKRPDEFVVGREGIIIRKGHANAVFLPRLPSNRGGIGTRPYATFVKRQGYQKMPGKMMGWNFMFLRRMYSVREKSPDCP